MDKMSLKELLTEMIEYLELMQICWYNRSDRTYCMRKYTLHLTELLSRYSHLRV